MLPCNFPPPPALARLLCWADETHIPRRTAGRPVFAVRYGFPGKTNRSWGWLGGASGDEALPWEEDEDEEEDEEEEGEGEGGLERVAVGKAGATGGGTAAPTRGVVALTSWQDLRALVEEGGTMVFVSSRSCRACKYLTP